METPSIQPGIYRHFKGKHYQVIGVAQKVDSSDFLVVYRPLYGDRRLVVRPYANFVEKVRVGGTVVPRFQFESRLRAGNIIKAVLGADHPWKNTLQGGVRKTYGKRPAPAV